MLTVTKTVLSAYHLLVMGGGSLEISYSNILIRGKSMLRLGKSHYPEPVTPHLPDPGCTGHQPQGQALQRWGVISGPLTNKWTEGLAVKVNLPSLAQTPLLDLPDGLPLNSGRNSIEPLLPLSPEVLPHCWVQEASTVIQQNWGDPLSRDSKAPSIHGFSSMIKKKYLLTSLRAEFSLASHLFAGWYQPS